LTVWGYPVWHDLNLSNRPVRTRMPGGVAGALSGRTAPYADGVCTIAAETLQYV